MAMASAGVGWGASGVLVVGGAVAATMVSVTCLSSVDAIADELSAIASGAGASLFATVTANVGVSSTPTVTGSAR